MTRENFIKIIKLRSIWKISKRMGNYELPSGRKLSHYVEKLVKSQMDVDKLGIRKNGKLCYCEYKADSGKFLLMPSFEEIEECTLEDMAKRIQALVFDIIF